MLRGAFLAAFSLAACAPERATPPAAPPAAAPPPAALAQAEPEASSIVIEDVGSLKIRLIRTECYGTCPWYGVEIRGDGGVTYCGVRWVKEAGERTRVIPEADVLRLVDKFHAADFFNLQDQYVAGITDMPTYVVELSYDGRRKFVVDYFGHDAGMPASMTELETAIDEAAATDQWIGQDPNPPRQSGQPPACIKRFPVPR